MKWRDDVKKSITTIILKSSHKRMISPKKKSSPIYLSPKNLLCLTINWASRIEEQRRIIKNNEEKNPKLLFVCYFNHLKDLHDLNIR